jgi:hypothetical protein
MQREFRWGNLSENEEEYGRISLRWILGRQDGGSVVEYGNDSGPRPVSGFGALQRHITNYN